MGLGHVEAHPATGLHSGLGQQPRQSAALLVEGTVRKDLRAASNGNAIRVALDAVSEVMPE
jgi:hypothetical protein